ncbi:MAG: type II CAAX prenyl endopeptidase Rce1 family protein [Erythrobacter cryptus]
MARLTPPAARDASARVARAAGFADRASDLLAFLRRPTPAPACLGAAPLAGAGARGVAVALAAVLAVHLALDLPARLLLALADARAAFLPAPALPDMGLARQALVALLIAPVLEELAFRGWLSGRIAALRLALHGFAALGVLLARFLAPEGWQPGFAMLALGLVCAGLVQWQRAAARDAAVPGWFTRHFAAITWASALAFGLIHLGNYAPLAHPFGVLVVAPQVIGGLCLAYTRTRLGLGAAMAHHALYNLLWLAAQGAGG